MTEAQLRSAVVKLATLNRWMVHHTSDSRSLRTHHPGWPDLFMVRNGVVIAAELKVKGRNLTKSQWEWINALARVPGIHSCVWRESEWSNGIIEEMLR